MRTIKYEPNTITIIRMIIILSALQINFLTAANPVEIGHINSYSICVSCNNGIQATQKEESFNELLILAPTAPAEATFSDETAYSEINLVPVTPGEASFDDDPEFISVPVLGYLAPATVPEADFND
jgi:hypothetical protein